MKRGTREKKEPHGRRRADQTRSLFASPIIRFWALHYDFSIRLIDWSSKLVKIKSVPDKSIVVSRRHQVEGEKTCRQFWNPIKLQSNIQIQAHVMLKRTTRKFIHRPRKNCRWKRLRKFWDYSELFTIITSHKKFYSGVFINGVLWI